MVRIVIAGSTSELAREIIDQLSATRKHEIIVLGRKDPSAFPEIPGVQWKQTSFESQPELVELLKDSHTVLCFLNNGDAQKRLVDAAIEAGVKRFAPSEWSMGEELVNCLDAFSWYTFKVEMRDYLRQINSKSKVIEYTLFQPGIFMEYLGYPKRTAKHLSVIPTSVNLESGRIIALQDHLDDPITYTSVEDIAGVVVQAIDYQGEWPVVGGISGHQISIRQLQQLGEKKLGRPFQVDLLQKSDIEAGVLHLDDVPRLEHPAIPKDQIEEFSKIGVRGLLLSLSRGGWTVSSDWNKLLPSYEFTSVDKYMEKLSK